jgi:predicted enzyme related to lactoylglutathione lyase
MILMKSEFHGLRTTIYKVTDIKKAKAWYSNVLGIEPYFDEPFYVGFNVGGYELGLQPEEGDEGKAKGGVATYWGVADVKKTYERLLSQGAAAHESPVDVGGEIIVATIKDPWGNIFGIIYNPHFKIEGS